MSLDILLNICDGNNIPNVVIFDECHHVLAKSTQHIFANFNFDNTKLLFFSATIPDSYDFGPLAYKLSLSDAININVCKDFDLIIDVLDDFNNIHIYNSIAKHSLSSGNLKIITFHNTINKNNTSVYSFHNDIKSINQSFSDFSEKHFDIHINDIVIYPITSDTKNKFNIINNFDNYDEKSPIMLSSCKSLSEGVDIKNANCVCFSEPKFSSIDIIQIIGRITRNVDRKLTYVKPIIILPITRNRNYTKIIDIAKHLKKNDTISIHHDNKYNIIESTDNICEKLNYYTQSSRSTETTICANQLNTISVNHTNRMTDDTHPIHLNINVSTGNCAEILISESMKNFYENLEKNAIKFENIDINIVIDNSDKIWFCAREVIIALKYKDIKDVIKKHISDDDKTHLKYINHSIDTRLHPNTVFINESGLYKLIFRSKMKKAKIFTNWVTNEVLPSIRKFGYYKIKNAYEKQKNYFLDKINYLEKQNKLMAIDLKKEKYPDGALVYIIDYSNDDNYEKNVFRLGSTGNLNKRKHIHNKTVVDTYFTKKTLQFETCIRSMLYDYRYKNKKDFYLCNKSFIAKAFKNCIKSIKNMTQTGGNNEIFSLQNNINNLNIQINEIIKLLNSNIY